AIENIFNGEKYVPPKLSEEERAFILLPPKETPPLHVQGEFPEFLENQLRERFGENLLPEMAALTGRAPIDLRVNTLKTTRDEVLNQLRDAGYDANPTPYSPSG